MMEEFFNRLTTPCVIIAWVHVTSVVLSLVVNITERMSK